MFIPGLDHVSFELQHFCKTGQIEDGFNLWKSVEEQWNRNYVLSNS